MGRNAGGFECADAPRVTDLDRIMRGGSPEVPPDRVPDEKPAAHRTPSMRLFVTAAVVLVLISIGIEVFWPLPSR